MPLTRSAVHRLTEIGWDGDDYRPLGRCVDEKAIVNAVVGLFSGRVGGAILGNTRAERGMRLATSGIFAGLGLRIGWEAVRA